jgi:hypothetical protein
MREKVYEYIKAKKGSRSPPLRAVKLEAADRQPALSLAQRR